MLSVTTFSNDFTLLHNCLREACQEDEADFSLLDIFVGWGTGSNSNDLYQVYLGLVRQDTCDQELILYVNETMICAGNVANGGRDTCQVAESPVKTCNAVNCVQLMSSRVMASVNPQPHGVNGNRVKRLVSRGPLFVSL